VASGFSRTLAPIFVGGFCLLYVVLVVALTLHFEGVFR